MNVCSSCGARLTPQNLACPFCSAVTPAGYARQAEDERQRQADALRAAQQEQQQRNLAAAAVANGAKQSLIWSIVGLVLCCLPVPAVVAAVLAFRARAAARAQGFPAPAQTVIALVLSAVSLVVFVAFVVFGITDSMRVNRDKEALRKTIEGHDTAATLTPETACAMTHLLLLERGYGEKGGNLVQDFDCAGALVQTADRATIDDVRFRTSSTGPTLVIAACLKHGTRWIVDELREDRRCDTPSSASDAAAPASAPIRGVPVREAGAAPSGKRDAGR